MRTVSAAPQVRILLWVGFGGLVVLLVFTGVNALSVVNQVQVRNEKIRSDYLERARILEQLRSDIYLSGTYVRDFLLETDEQKAEIYRTEVAGTQGQIERAVQQYRRIRHPQEARIFDYLEKQVKDYFDTLKPALGWTTEQRKNLGRAFTRDEVLRRRSTMIKVADQVEQINQWQLESGNTLVQQLFAEFKRRLFLLLVLTVSMGVLLASISMWRILHLEHESQRRYREIAQARRESQDLSAKLVDTQEEERRSIARELHDEVGQSLSALILGISNISNSLSADADASVRSQMLALKTLAEKSVAVVRNMTLLLRPSMLDDLGLVPALQWQGREMSRATGMRVGVAAEGVSDDIPEEHKTCVYRIVQEALRNCQRHSHAQHVRIQLEQTESRWLLSIQDDGCGFRAKDRGLGLLGIEERVRRLGGRFQIDSEAAQGTLLSIELPRNRST